MKQTYWIGKENGKASEPKNWDNGVPDYRTKAVFDVSERTEVTWDLNSLGIPVEIIGDPEDLIIYISGDCMVGGGYFVPDVIRDHFESFKDDSVNPDTFDRPPPGYGLLKIPMTFTWTDNSSGNTNWTDQLNWNDGSSGYPDDNNDKAFFDDTWTAACTVNSAITVGMIELASGYTNTISLNAKVIIDEAGDWDGELKVSAGTFDANDQDINIDGSTTITATAIGGSGTWTIYGNWDNSGTFTYETSTVKTTGNSSISIKGGNNGFWNLTIDNSNSVNVTINGDLRVGGAEPTYGGQLNGTGSCTLKLDSGDPDIYTHGNVSLSSGFSITKGNGLWKFYGGEPGSTYSDGNATAQNLGDIQTECENGDTTLIIANQICCDNLLVFADNTFDASEATNIYCEGNLTIGTVQGPYATLIAGTSTIYCKGNWTNICTFTCNTSTVQFNGSSEQYISPGGDAFYNLEINNSHASAHVDILDTLDINGTFNLDDGILDIGTDDPAVNTAGNVTWTSGCTVYTTRRSETWTFDGTLTYTDNNATAQNIGNAATTASVGGITVTIANKIHFDNVNIGTNTTLAAASGVVGATIYCDGDWANSGAFTHGNGSVIMGGDEVDIRGMSGSTNKFYNLTIEVDVTTSTKVSYGSIGGTNPCLTKDQAGSFNTLTIDNTLTVNGTFHVASNSGGTECD